MNATWRARTVAVTVLALVIVAALPAQADDELGWKDVAEFSLVTTSGNSESTSFGFKNLLTRDWERAKFTLKAGGIRVDTTTRLRPVGTPAAFTIPELDETTAENYYLNGRYDREITERFFWYAGAGWDRNRFAGIQNRYTAGGGVGHIWFDTDDRKFRTAYGVTYTDQEDVFEVPGSDDTFAGWQASWDYLNKLTDSATYENILVLDGNLDETSDYRADMINSLAVAMSERMALKVSLQLLYDNVPSFEVLNLVDGAGVPTGQSVTVELDDLDTILTASLVINF